MKNLARQDGLLQPPRGRGMARPHTDGQGIAKLSGTVPQNGGKRDGSILTTL